MPDEIILYGIKQTSSKSGKTYYRNFRDYNWTDEINEKCLLAEKWLVEEIRDHLNGYSEIVTFSLKEKKTNE